MLSESAAAVQRQQTINRGRGKEGKKEKEDVLDLVLAVVGRDDCEGRRSRAHRPKGGLRAVQEEEDQLSTLGAERRCRRKGKCYDP